MNILLALCAAGGFALSNIAFRVYQIRLRPGTRGCALFCALAGLASTVVYLVMAAFSWSLSAAGFGISLLYGLCLALAGLASALGYLWGPVSLTAVIMDASLVIPVLYGSLFLREQITLPQLCGIVLLLVMFLISSPISRDVRGTLPIRWYLVSLAAFLFNGLSMVTMKRFKLAALGSDSAFLAIGTLLNTVVLAAMYLYLRRRGREAPQSMGRRQYVLIAALIVFQVLTSLLASRLMMALSAKVPASLLYPLINGGNCVLISLVSCTFLHEKLTRRKLIAMSFGICAIVALNL